MSEPAGNPPADQNQVAVVPYESWSTNIPADYKDGGYWKNFENKPLGDVLKSYGEAQKYMGASVRVPTDENDTDGWNKVYSKLGRPESPDKYDVKLPAIPGFQWSEESLKGVKEVAHKHGVSGKALNEIIGWYGQNLGTKLSTASQAEKVKIDATTSKLKGEWGVNYDPNLALAKQAARHYFGEGSESIVDAAFADGEHFVRGLVKLGHTMNEHGFVPGGGGQFKGLTKGEAVTKIATIMADATHAYHKGGANNPAVAEMASLHNIAYPDNEYME